MVLSECPELFSLWFIHFIKHAYSQSEPAGHSRSASCELFVVIRATWGMCLRLVAPFCIHMLLIWSIYTTPVLDSALWHNHKWSSLVGGFLSGLLKVKPMWQTLEYMRSHFVSHFVNHRLKLWPVVVLHSQTVKLCDYDHRRQHWDLQLWYRKNGIKSALAWMSKSPLTIRQNSDRSFV